VTKLQLFAGGYGIGYTGPDMRQLLDEVEDALALLSLRLSSLKFVVEAEEGQLLPAAWGRGKMVQQVYDQQQQLALAAQEGGAPEAERGRGAAIRPPPAAA
jgi:hypothetical protein